MASDEGIPAGGVKGEPGRGEGAAWRTLEKSGQKAAYESLFHAPKQSSQHGGEEPG